EENYPLEEISWADLTDFPLDKYLYQKKPLITLITSRSCPYQCTFCSIKNTFGKKYRNRNATDIFEEIKFRYIEGYRIFNFEDDNLTFDKNEFQKLCLSITDYFSSVIDNVPEFMAMNGIAYFNIDKEILLNMKYAFFKHLNLSLVSSNEQTLTELKRPHNLNNFINIVNEAFKLNFEIVAYLIIGLPNENITSMISSIVTLTELPLLIGASIFYLNPGSPMFNNSNSNNYNNNLINKKFEDAFFNSRLTSLQLENKFINRDQIHTLFLAVRIINFLKGLSPLFSSSNHINNHKSPITEFKLSVILNDKFNNNYSHRANIGVNILNRLFTEKKMYLYNKNGFSVRNAFCMQTFSNLWNSIKFIQTQQGLKILNDINLYPMI
ncbi:MAG: radical SAM protein, partial [Oligoflexia bacterium]|nr:radical SAM protein [Oligoflexia bacterium]